MMAYSKTITITALHARLKEGHRCASGLWHSFLRCHG
jgi:hypothetical protein